MIHQKIQRLLPFNITYIPAIAFLFLFLTACNESHVHIGEKEVVKTPEDINARAEEVIQGTLKDILYNNRDLSDSFRIKNAPIVQYLYDQHSFEPLWTSRGAFNRNADSLFALIKEARTYGLFPEDYYYSRLMAQKALLVTDTSREKKLDASIWAYCDLMFTSAFVQLIKDLKAGRLLPDSVLAKDSLLTESFFLQQFREYGSDSNTRFAAQLEPRHAGYEKLKGALAEFLPKANFRAFTFVDAKDSAKLPALLYKRLSEEDSTLEALPDPDSIQLARAIKKYQKHKSLKVTDGKLTTALINRLNNSDKEKFIRIGITMDKYKQLPEMPEQYIWVNIPGYYLHLKQADTVVLQSKVVVGKPETRTPELTSTISNMVTYPQWTIPESIIKKEILPGLKRDPGYTLKKGYSLVDKDGNEVDPYGVNWSKYREYIPYKVVQGSGDANALGVLKFNFPNKYSVYLHDTNQRYLFSRTSRALSHGCVRVQAWEDLATFILRNDSLYSEKAIPVDSMQTWLELKEKHYIPVRKPLPLFIRYFSCEVNEKGSLVFYDDVYGEDRKLREKIFAKK